jgi:hypothetical protein
MYNHIFIVVLSGKTVVNDALRCKSVISQHKLNYEINKYLNFVYPLQQVLKVMYVVYCNTFGGQKLFVLKVIYELLFIALIRQPYFIDR